MRKIAGVVLDTIAAFLVYVAQLAALIRTESLVAKSITIAMIAAVACIFLAGGVALARAGSRQRTIAVVLLSGSSITVFAIVMFVCMALDPGFHRIAGPGTQVFARFSDFESGATLTIATLALAGLLLRWSRGPRDAPG